MKLGRFPSTRKSLRSTESPACCEDWPITTREKIRTRLAILINNTDLLMTEHIVPLFNLLRLRVLTRTQPQNHSGHLSIFIFDEHHFRLRLFSEELSL